MHSDNTVSSKGIHAVYCFSHWPATSNDLPCSCGSGSARKRRSISGKVHMIFAQTLLTPCCSLQRAVRLGPTKSTPLIPNKKTRYAIGWYNSTHMCVSSSMHIGQWGSSMAERHAQPWRRQGLFLSKFKRPKTAAYCPKTRWGHEESTRETANYQLNSYLY